MLSTCLGLAETYKKSLEKNKALPRALIYKSFATIFDVSIDIAYVDFLCRLRVSLYHTDL